MFDFLHDLRYAARALWARPTFSLVVVATLALAIGANTATFSIVHGILMRSLGVAEPEHVVAFRASHETLDLDDYDFSHADVADLIDNCDACQTVTAIDGRSPVLTTRDSAVRLRGIATTPTFFDVLGVAPAIGRAFTDTEARTGEAVALVSDRVWQQHFDSDPALVGRTVRLDGQPVAVIGVMPERFRFPEAVDVWQPLRLDPDQPRDARGIEQLFARLDPGAGVGDADHEAQALAERLATDHPDTNAGWQLTALPLRKALVDEQLQLALWLLLGAVAFVLLIACTNVANLMLSRESARQREIAVRTALGGSGWRIARQMLAESLMLSLAGSAFGLLLAAWAIDYIVVTNPEEPAYWMHFAIDRPVLLFTLGLTVAAALLFGTLPAWRAVRPRALAGLRAGDRAGLDRERQRWQRSLVVAEIALAVVLVFSASLLIGSSHALLEADPGFVTDDLLTLRTELTADRFTDRTTRIHFLEEARSRLTALSGVEQAAFTGAVPMDDEGADVRLIAEGRPVAPGNELPINVVPSSHTLFTTLGLAPLTGRTFTARESLDTDCRNVLVNRRLAILLWPGEDPVGKRIRFRRDAGQPWRTVVGVVPDLQYEELGEDTRQTRMQVHLPYAAWPWRSMALLVRTSGAPERTLETVATALHQLDPVLPLWDVRTMPEVHRTTTWGSRIFGQMFGAFALVALALGAIGVYGVMAFAVSQRLREIGIRMALGADRRQVNRLVLGEGTLLAAIGVGIGIAGSLATVRVLESIVWGVRADDPRFLIGAPLTLLTATLLATALPANRAASVDPATTLRAE